MWQRIQRIQHGGIRMKKNTSLLSACSKIPETCNYCDNKAEYYLLAKGLFMLKEAILCKRHAKEWYAGVLNI